MRVIIKDTVYLAVEDFYMAAMEKHPTLDMQTVLNKEERLYSALETLGRDYYLYKEARYVIDWKRRGYLDFMYENFHFAYQVAVLPTGEVVVAVEDARHDLTFHD